ncbi:MAG: ABC transporter permease subunit [Pseudomonas sp.]|uniref:ABC transporter permease n=1 Tax=Pseudomonas sp. TaxID=306 RepID=UPI00299EED76|nr:ABC transporter permease subunit [Pseudomonas sp.]MDX1725940.1 ABC transporter permease subunit [Pseudomonas sp.]
MITGATAVTTVKASGLSPIIASRRTIGFVLLAILIVVAGRIGYQQLDWVTHYPSAWVLPLSDWISAFFEWLVYDFRFFRDSALEFSARDVTRGFGALLNYPLAFTESLFFSGFNGQVPALPWVTVVGLAFVLGHWAGGWRVALIGGLAFLYLAVFGVWQASMQTFALVIVTVPLVFSLGLLFGILMARHRTFETLVTPLFDMLQSMPPFAYMVPIVVMYGVGNVPAMVVTAVFAVPPVARCVALGLKSISHELIEAGLMMGCTPLQLLCKVRMPAARETLLVGLNQGIMQTLAMIVLASLIGASGLGSQLLTSLQSLRLGQALEQGLAIVVIAVALDRLSRAYARKPPTYSNRSLSAWRRHPYLTMALVFIPLSIGLAHFIPALGVLSDTQTLSTAPWWDAKVEWVTVHWYDSVQTFRNFMLMQALIPIRDFFQSTPWVTFVGLVALLGHRLGGWRLALGSSVLMLFPVVTGLWTQTMTTVYMIGTAAAVCIVIGFLLGVSVAGSQRLSKITLGLCDFFQTFPSFIYLIPVVMLFKVSDLSAIIAVLLFAVVPMVRYTILGLRNVSPRLLETVTQQGTTRWQRLVKVKLPIALPEIMLGISQVIFMALFMVAITSLIGTQDLGAEINAARSGNDTGRALVAGLCIAFLGIVADRLIGAWAKRKKAELGVR